MTRVTFALFFGSTLLLAAQPLDQMPQQALASAAAQLAGRTSSLLPRRTTVSLELKNQTWLPAAEWSSFRSLFQDELHKAGVETGTPPDPRVRVTLSEDARGLLFVAEVLTGDTRQIAMLPWSLPSSTNPKPRIRITEKALWTQPDPILDILLFDSDSQMLVLSANRVASYRLMADKWLPSATDSLVLPRPLPRDPRGRLEAIAGGFEVFLPVATCTGVWIPELKLTCASDIANWPGTLGTHWVADRNVWEGNVPTPSFEGWGSDWASVADSCGDGRVDIASSPSTEHDSVRAYLIRDSHANPVSDPLPLLGPVTALWPAESHAQATLVVRNLQTGEYEASRLSLACTE